jgi:hypothetical protein
MTMSTATFQARRALGETAKTRVALASLPLDLLAPGHYQDGRQQVQRVPGLQTVGA